MVKIMTYKHVGQPEQAVLDQFNGRTWDILENAVKTTRGCGTITTSPLAELKGSKRFYCEHCKTHVPLTELEVIA